MDNDTFLQRAGRIAGVGGWRVNLQTMAVEWSNKTCEILGYPEHYHPTLQEALDLYTDESRPVISAMVEDAITHGTPFDGEFTVHHKSGAVIWVRSIGETEYADGKPVFVAGAFQDITERKTNEAKIAAGLEATKKYYDNAPCGYYSLGPDRTIMRANNILLSWLGCSADEVIGLKKPTEFMTPESLAPAILAFRQLMETGEVSGLECELLPVDGVTRHVSISAKAYFDVDGTFLSSSSVMYDITDLVKQRQRADRLSQDLMSIIDNDFVGTITVKNRTILWANKAMHRLFGYADSELVGQPTRIAYKNDASFQHIGTEAYPHLAAGSTYRSELEMVRKDGSPIWVQMNGMGLKNGEGETVWMMSDVTEHKQKSAHHQFMALHDALTGLPNRHAFAKFAQGSLDTAAKGDTKTAICFLDLDGFKVANDTFGHERGDTILKTVAERLRACIRINDAAFRFGGDEFAIILNDLSHSADVDAILHRVLEELNLPIPVEGTLYAKISGSIGVSMFPDDERDDAALLHQADTAMYQAKRNGKNGIVKFADLVSPTVQLRQQN